MIISGKVPPLDPATRRERRQSKVVAQLELLAERLERALAEEDDGLGPGPTTERHERDLAATRAAIARLKAKR
jgi:hypothetical protein